MRGKATHRLGLVAVLVLCIAAAASPATASALSKRQADRIALRTLKPKKHKGDVVVFGLRRPLARGTAVYEAGLPRSTATRKRGRRGRGSTRRIRPLPGKSWLYVMDLTWQAKFQHPMVLALVDDRTRRVSTRKVSWQIAIGNKLAPFFRGAKAYMGSKYRVFGPRARRGRRDRPGITLLSGVSQNDFGNALTSGPHVRPHCVVAAGQGSDVAAMRRWAKSVVGARVFRLPFVDAGSGFADTGNGFSVLSRGIEKVDGLTRCRDVLIYLSGGGYRSGPPAVVVGPARATFLGVRRGAGGPLRAKIKPNEVTADDLRKLVRAHRRVGTTFKFKIDAPYSSGFIGALKDEPNVLVVETSSKANEPAYGQMDGHTTAAGEFIPNPAAGSPVSQFTQQNIRGLQRLADDQSEVNTLLSSGRSPLAWALVRALELGANQNFALSQGLQHPQVYSAFPVHGPPPPLEGTGNFGFANPGNPSQGVFGELQFNQPVTGIRIVVPHPITNFAANGQPFSNDGCAVDTEGPTSNNRLTCTGATAVANQVIRVALQTNPPLTAGEGGDLFGQRFSGGPYDGPYGITGP